MLFLYEIRKTKNETTFQCSSLSHALQDYGEKHKKNLAEEE